MRGSNVLFIMIVAFVGCHDAGNEPTVPSDLQISNIRWDIVAINSSDVSRYKMFSVVLGAGTIWGTDGCNFLRGTYEFHSNTLVITDGAITEIGCNVPVIPFAHLSTHPSVVFGNNSMTLYGNGATYTYGSNYTADVANALLVQNSWVMVGSNDPNFVIFRVIDRFPTLSLNGDRTFSLEWHNRPVSQPEPFSNIFSGVFGINSAGGFQLTIINSQYAGNNTSSQDSDLISAMNQSTSYEYVGTGLRLVNAASGMYYDFSMLAGPKTGSRVL